MRMDFVPTKEREDGCLVLPKGVREEGHKKWVNTLVGYFVDHRLPFKVVKERVVVMWGQVWLNRGT